MKLSEFYKKLGIGPTKKSNFIRVFVEGFERQPFEALTEDFEIESIELLLKDRKHLQIIIRPVEENNNEIVSNI